MPNGSISSSADAVGVAVVNWQVPVCESLEDVLANCHKIADCIEGVKRGAWRGGAGSGARMHSSIGVGMWPR